MPLYDYQCADCGSFDQFQPVSRFSDPVACPACGDLAPRVIRAPQLLTMEGSLRKAYATNEKNQHEPMFSTRSDRAHKHEHGPGCSCCSSGKVGQSKALHGADGSKTFPSQRPWMISH